VHKNYDLAGITNDADADADADAEEDILDEECLDDIIDYGEDELLDALEEFDCQYKRKVKDLSKVVANFRKNTKYIQKLTNASEKLNGIQYTNGSSIALSLDADVCTRWNSTLIMLKKIVQLKTPLCIFMQYLKSLEGKRDF
jgi:hypothetical protein